jgi:hypothetical protein
MSLLSSPSHHLSFHNARSRTASPVASPVGGTPLTLAVLRECSPSLASISDTTLDKQLTLLADQLIVDVGQLAALSKEDLEKFGLAAGVVQVLVTLGGVVRQLGGGGVVRQLGGGGVQPKEKAARVKTMADVGMHMKGLSWETLSSTWTVGTLAKKYRETPIASGHLGASCFNEYRSVLPWHSVAISLALTPLAR